MSNVVTPVSITALFNKPRMLYVEMLRKRLESEIKGVLTLMRFYRQHHSDQIMSSSTIYSADDIITAFTEASILLHQTRTLSEVRAVHQRVARLKEQYDRPLESVFFSMALIHGFED